MSKTRWFSSPQWSGFVKQNNLDDVIDLQKGGRRSFKDLKSLLGVKREREAERISKEVLSDFFELVARDMIMDRSVFIFPAHSFGYMRIGDIGKDAASKDLFKRVEDDFMIPGGRIYTREMIKKVNGGKTYRFKMVTPLLQMLREEQHKGKRYVE